MKKYLIDKHNQQQHNQVVNNLEKLALVAESILNKQQQQQQQENTSNINSVEFKKEYNLRQIIKTTTTLNHNPCFLLRKDINFCINNNNSSTTTTTNNK